MPYNFSLLWAPWSASGFRSRIDAMEAALPEGAWPNLVLGNHEREFADRTGPKFDIERYRIVRRTRREAQGDKKNW